MWITEKLQLGFRGWYIKQYLLHEAQREFSQNKALLADKDRAYTLAARRYWKDNLGVNINPLWHTAMANYTGVKDPRYVPHNVWWTRILPFFNAASYRPAYIDKNLAEILLRIDRQVKCPQTVIKRMHGYYYDSDNKAIDSKTALRMILDGPIELIIKGSDTDNGIGVRKLSINNSQMQLEGKSVTWGKLEELYGQNFIVQHVIQQHEIMAEPHWESVNTIRVITFRWQMEIIALLHYVRIGSEGKITDNGSTGGMNCGIDDEGRLYPEALDHKCNRISQHPNTGYDFAQRKVIPSYPRIIELAKELHKNVFHFGLVSFDFAIDKYEEPVFVEMNFRGSAWICQMACEKPIFGDLTEDVLRSMKRTVCRE